MEGWQVEDLGWSISGVRDQAPKQAAARTAPYKGGRTAPRLAQLTTSDPVAGRQDFCRLGGEPGCPRDGGHSGPEKGRELRFGRRARRQGFRVVTVTLDSWNNPITFCHYRLAIGR